jgi:hypothetical protein
MEYELKYPLYAVRQGEDFACTSAETAEGKEIFALALFTSVDLATRYAAHNGWEARFTRIKTPGALRDFLAKMESDVVAVAVDLMISEDGTVTAASSEVIEELLNRLPEIAFTWDYPLHILEVAPGGFATINGTAADGSNFDAVAVFTDDDLAERYRDAEEPAASIRPLNDAAAFARFLKLCHRSTAVSFDLVRSSQGSIAKNCVKIETLLRDLPEVE